MKDKSMNTLRLLKLQFQLRFTADTVLLPFVGNTFRGALGSALSKCSSPAYDAVFKTGHTTSVPNPYTISIPYPAKERYHKGEALHFGITLFGDACEYREEIEAAVRHMCHGKLENCVLEEAELIYDRIWSDNGANTIPQADHIVIHFITPTELISEQKSVKEVEWNIFIDSLFGRICDVIGNYTAGEFVIPYALFARKQQIMAQYRLETIRFQTNKQPICGVVGEVEYKGDVTRYLPYIDLGSQLHIGKKTTRGCGEYWFWLG
jgi:hypothetical protein